MVIRNGVNGYVDTRVCRLIEVAVQLRGDPALAHAWGRAARETALARFGMGRFISDWVEIFDSILEAA